MAAGLWYDRTLPAPREVSWPCHPSPAEWVDLMTAVRKPAPAEATFEALSVLAVKIDAMDRRVDQRLSALESGQAELRTSVSQLQTGQAELQTGQAELQTGQAELRTSVAELQTGQAELRTSVAELQTGQAALQTGMAILNENQLHTNRALAAILAHLGVPKSDG